MGKIYKDKFALIKKQITKVKNKYLEYAENCYVFFHTHS